MIRHESSVGRITAIEPSATPRAWARDQSGSSLIELAVMLPVLLLLLIGAFDLGRACYAAIEVSSAASAGALYGTQNVTDIAGMQAAAALDAPDLVGIIPIGTYGCECSDGSSSTANCSSTPSCAQDVVRYVQVNTTFLYVPLLRYPGVPESILLQGRAHLRARP